LQNEHPQASQERPLTPAFVCPTWPIGAAPNGIVTYTTAITAAFRALGHRPCVLTKFLQGYSAGPDEYSLEAGERSLPSRLFESLAFRVNPRAALRNRNSAAIVAATRRAIAQSGVELLEMEETFGIGHLVKRSLSIPVAIEIHGPFFANGAEAKLVEEPEGRQRIADEGVTIAQADGVASPSREILERTRAYYQLPLAGALVNPCPAPTVPPQRRWRLADCDRNAILFVGRFDRHKGGDIMIEAFRRIAPDFPQLRLWFVGRDHGFVDDSGRQFTLSEYLNEKAREIAGRVDFLGRLPQNELDALRARPYATVVASRYETFGLVVTEAMAYGSPLVATRVGGIPEAVDDGVNGLLCRPEADHLAASLRRLLNDPLLAARLGERGAEDAAQRFSPDTLARARAEFHRDIIERHAAKQRGAA
jgi:glycosyltransferase involved in cell wall biosynthesis